MRYLIHSSDCTHNTVTGEYTLELDRRIGNPQSLKIVDVVYEAPTLATYPIAIYLNSVGINQMIMRKHTLRLTENNHENDSDVLAVLTDSYEEGRYRMKGSRRFTLNPQTYLRTFDFKFTDNQTVVGGGGGSDDFWAVEDDMDTPTGQEKTGKIFRAFDTGGSDADYGVNESLNRIYISENDVNWKFTFLNFSSESGFDKLKIVEVDSGGGEVTLVDDHSGTSLPSPTTYTSTKSKLKFYWTSDSSNQDIGFDIILWEDNEGANTLLLDGGEYKVRITSSNALAKFVVQMDIVATH